MSVCCGWLSIISCICTIICLSLAFLASPLQSVEAITFGNVLGTQKQLIFNFHARARYSAIVYAIVGSVLSLAYSPLLLH